ncbi:Hypothetical predicted protein [Octopus vulgaris]|uniref:Uncharacterized protein n=1 Tax=Octopus vulgaris TaxID=6645 RepID=A0AA36BGC1_OCTVU|nr:Hypothetical predicted protein [Octopus vulgaris]
MRPVSITPGSTTPFQGSHLYYLHNQPDGILPSGPCDAKHLRLEIAESAVSAILLRQGQQNLKRININGRPSQERHTANSYSIWRTRNQDSRPYLDENKLANVRRDILRNNRLTDSEISAIKHATENDINIRHKGNEESDEQYSPPRGLIERLPSDQSTQRPEDTRNSIVPVKDSQENDETTVTEDLAFAEEHRESMAEMRQKILNTLEVFYLNFGSQVYHMVGEVCGRARNLYMRGEKPHPTRGDLRAAVQEMQTNPEHLEHWLKLRHTPYSKRLRYRNRNRTDRCITTTSQLDLVVSFHEIQPLVLSGRRRKITTEASSVLLHHLIHLSQEIL